MEQGSSRLPVVLEVERGPKGFVMSKWINGIESPLEESTFHIYIMSELAHFN